MFLPNPPKTHLPKTTPKAMPTMATQMGVEGGKVSVNKAQDTRTASDTLALSPLIRRRMPYSHRMPVAVTTASRSKVRRPKSHNENRRMGERLINTLVIIFCFMNRLASLIISPPYMALVCRDYV